VARADSIFLRIQSLFKNTIDSDMEDIDLARSLLEGERWNLVIVKEGQILFNSRERGVAPFFQAVQSMGRGLHNAAVADRIVGLAVAMLCDKGVVVTSKSTVPHISNYDGTDLCPFEKLAAGCAKPSELLAALQSLFAQGDQ
jgi:hypothetical protein